jgi:hypothetical protein
MDEPENFPAIVAEWTDEELLDSWETASDEETENLSPLLAAVVTEMEKRAISF